MQSRPVLDPALRSQLHEPKHGDTKRGGAVRDTGGGGDRFFCFEASQEVPSRP
jgi:hypothetical protein